MSDAWSIANAELCRKLYKLSGWHTGKWFGDEVGLVELPNTPQYDLGYLLRRLRLRLSYDSTKAKWRAHYQVYGRISRSYYSSADSPEDAACKLAIRLFKRGLIK